MEFLDVFSSLPGESTEVEQLQENEEETGAMSSLFPPKVAPPPGFEGNKDESNPPKKVRLDNGETQWFSITPDIKDITWNSDVSPDYYRVSTLPPRFKIVSRPENWIDTLKSPLHRSEEGEKMGVERMTMNESSLASTFLKMSTSSSVTAPVQAGGSGVSSGKEMSTNPYHSNKQTLCSLTPLFLHPQQSSLATQHLITTLPPHILPSSASQDPSECGITMEEGLKREEEIQQLYLPSSQGHNQPQSQPPLQGLATHLLYELVGRIDGGGKEGEKEGEDEEEEKEIFLTQPPGFENQESSTSSNKSSSTKYKRTIMKNITTKSDEERKAEWEMISKELDLVVSEEDLKRMEEEEAKRKEEAEQLDLMKKLKLDQERAGFLDDLLSGLDLNEEDEEDEKNKEEEEEAPTYTPEMRWADTSYLPPEEFEKLRDKMVMSFPFELDPFQKQAVMRLERRENVFVSAHTSAGKTVVAEYAISMALSLHSRLIYTSPIKALSNQKYKELKEKYGDVGIITGDVCVNRKASVLIMTTEILRSIIYIGDDLIRDVSFVVFDEVHFMNDEERGVVWEESMILLPPTITLIFLSATTPSPQVFSEWIGRMKQRKVCVISTPHRPVPLVHSLHVPSPHHTHALGYDEEFGTYNETSMMTRGEEEKKGGSQKEEEEEEDDNVGSGVDMSVLHRSLKIFPVKNIGEKYLEDGLHDCERFITSHMSKKRRDNPAPRRHQCGGGGNKNDWRDLAKALIASNLTPCIIFLFSRKMCEQKAHILSDQSFLTKGERARVVGFVNSALASLSAHDRNLPQIKVTLDHLKSGVGVHHSGLLPILKEITEMLFQMNLVRVLIATETFAMGVNFPAKCVVFGGLRKHDGTSLRFLHPGEYTQMSGRAGRRGIDPFGHVLICTWQDPPKTDTLKTLLTGESPSLSSQFRLTYSMILNLLRSHDMNVEDVMRRSFSEFHTQRLLGGRDVREKSDRLEVLVEKLQRELWGQQMKNERIIREQKEEEESKKLPFEENEEETKEQRRRRRREGRNIELGERIGFKIEKEEELAIAVQVLCDLSSELLLQKSPTDIEFLVHPGRLCIVSSPNFPPVVAVITSFVSIPSSIHKKFQSKSKSSGGKNKGNNNRTVVDQSGKRGQMMSQSDYQKMMQQGQKQSRGGNSSSKKFPNSSNDRMNRLRGSKVGQVKVMGLGNRKTEEEKKKKSEEMAKENAFREKEQEERKTLIIFRCLILFPPTPHSSHSHTIDEQIGVNEGDEKNEEDEEKIGEDQPTSRETSARPVFKEMKLTCKNIVAFANEKIRENTSQEEMESILESMNMNDIIEQRLRQSGDIFPTNDRQGGGSKRGHRGTMQQQMYQEKIKHMLEFYQCNQTMISTPLFSDLFRTSTKLMRAKTTALKLKRLLGFENLSHFPEFQAKYQVLCKLGFIDEESETVTMKGRVGCEMTTCNELVSTELIFQNVLEPLSPSEVVALLSVLICQVRNPNATDQDLIGVNAVRGTPRLSIAKSQLLHITMTLGMIQSKGGIDIAPHAFVPQTLNFALMDVVYQWARGVHFSRIMEMTEIQEGTIVRTINRLDELCRNVRNAAKVMGDSSLYRKLEEASNKIKRDIVFTASLYLN